MGVFRVFKIVQMVPNHANKKFKSFFLLSLYLKLQWMI